MGSPAGLGALPANGTPFSDPVDYQAEAIFQIALHRARCRAFGEDATLFLDPAWQILLDLMAHNGGDRWTSISGCSLASGASNSTANRLISRLIDKGYISRTPDRDDGRRFLVRMTPLGRGRMESWLRIAAHGRARDGKAIHNHGAGSSTWSVAQSALAPGSELTPCVQHAA